MPGTPRKGVWTLPGRGSEEPVKRLSFKKVILALRRLLGESETGWGEIGGRLRKLIQVRDGGQSRERKEGGVWRGRLWALSLAVLCVSCSYIWHIEVGYVQGM